MYISFLNCKYNKNLIIGIKSFYFKKIGAKISIDDFGSGYSNFEYLAKLPIDFIKIDGSLIKNIDKDEDTRIVVEVIVNYAKKKGIKTVAEFVSSKDIYHVVKDIGVDLVQGFYIGKPTQNIDIKAL
ncbi:MAG TPA: EAL domain-containing protein [Campylobacterales bacterium]|nr:EAL domain-containing protein [Campylobacterales bacterium]